MPRFEVQGKGMSSGRARKRIYFAKDEISARQKAADDGTDIETIEELPPEPPTERQISYANDLGITIPRDATKDELSDLISCSTDEDQPASPELLGLARHYGIETTRYTGEQAVHWRIFNTLARSGREQELATWFAFNVLKWRPKARAGAGEVSLDNPRLTSIGSKLAADAKVMSSIKRYSESTLLWFGERTQKDGWVRQGGSNRTAAYKAAAELVDAEFGPVVTPTRRPKSSAESKGRATATAAKKRTKKRTKRKSGPSVATVAIFVVVFLFVLGTVL
jgi:hypothetical protein